MQPSAAQQQFQRKRSHVEGGCCARKLVARMLSAAPAFGHRLRIWSKMCRTSLPRSSEAQHSRFSIGHSRLAGVRKLAQQSRLCFLSAKLGAHCRRASLRRILEQFLAASVAPTSLFGLAPRRLLLPYLRWRRVVVDLRARSLGSLAPCSSAALMC